MSQKLLFILTLIVLPNLALAQSTVSIFPVKKDCKKGETCYCDHGTKYKALLGKGDDYVSVCKLLKDDSEVKKYKMPGNGPSAAERSCLANCGAMVGKEAVQAAEKEAAQKAAMPDPKALPPKLAKSFPCNGDGICVCTDAVENKAKIWESTCKHFKGEKEAVGTFKGDVDALDPKNTNTKQNAIKTCGRLCFGAQGRTLKEAMKQRADGTWQAAN